MTVNELLRYDIPPVIVDRWRDQVCDTLLPLQAHVLRRHDLFGGGNLLLQAPTSAGKTFVGEMAAIDTALRQKQAVYLVPLKALAEEKFQEFHQRYTDLGLRVILSTRDHRDHDRALEQGDFDLAVVVYEKLAQLLVRRPERVAEIDLVVADELEIIGDVDRGPGVELLLTRLLESRSRVIGLSAVMGGADRLAHWLEATLVSWEQRPIELRFGVLHEGNFEYRTGADSTVAVETLVEGVGDTAEEIALENLAAFSGAGERSLVFVRARHDTRMGARRIAHRLDLPPAQNALAALEALDSTRSREELAAVMTLGVAFHNADLSPGERRVVEQAFRDGEVLVLVSTSTLAVGLNLPARNVFLTTEKWCYDVHLGMPWKAPLSRMEYRNMAGRAGRLGKGHDYGRAILVATSLFEKEVCWRRYVEGELEHVEPQLDRGPLDDHVLRLIAAGHVKTLDQLQAFLEQTLTGRRVWSVSCSRDELAARICAAVRRAADHGMVTTPPSDSRAPIEITPFGRAVSSRGVDIESAAMLERWLSAAGQRAWSDADVLFAAATTPAGRSTHVLLTTREYEESGYVAELRDRARTDTPVRELPLARLCEARLQPFFEEVRAAKTTLFLLDWLAGTPLRTLEDRYHTMAGQVLAATAQIAWLLEALAAMARANGHATTEADRLEGLAVQLASGVKEGWNGIFAPGGPAVSRNDVLALERGGFSGLADIAAASVDTLLHYVPEEKARPMHAWAAARVGLAAHGEAADTPPGNECETRLVIDEARPNEIRLDAHRVALQRKQYELIRLLASVPGECVRYDTIYEALWGGVCVEPNQMHYQKRTLLQRIREACPGREQGLITTRNRFGFALNLKPESVSIRPARPAITA